MITTALRILLVENLRSDAEHIIHHIEKIVVDPKIRIVDNLDDCRKELENFVPDVVISEYNFPTCTGIEVQELTKQVDDTIPFIFITNSIDDEETAAHTILAGAFGFVLKKHMEILEEKLRPLLKKVVFNMVDKEEIREKIRRNKIAVNQIHQYLDNIRSDDKEQRMNISKIRDNIKYIQKRNEEE